MKNTIKVVIIVVIVLVIGVWLNFVLKHKNLEVKSLEYNYYKYYSNDTFGVIDKNGEILVKAEYSDIIIPNPSQPIFFLIVNDNVKNIVNEKNEKIFIDFEEVLPISISGLVSEIPYEKNVLIYKEKEKLGLIDLNGNKLTKAIYESIESLPYKEGELLCKTENNVYVLKSDGKEKMELEKDVEILADGFYDKNFFTERTGYILTKQTNSGNLYGYINYKGKMILDIEYDEINRIHEDEEALIIRKNGQYGLYKNGEFIINCNYQELNYDEEIHMFIAKRANKYGVLDKTSHVIIPIEYKKVESKGIFIEALSFDDLVKKFNLEGNEVNEYNNYSSIKKSEYDEDIYIAVTDDFLYKILDKNYNILTIKDYEYIENILLGTYIIKNSDGKYGLIDNNNIELIKSEYDVIQLINTTEVFQAMDLENNVISLYNKFGKKIFEEEDVLVILDKQYIKVFCDEGVKYFDFQGEVVKSEEIYKNNNIIGFYENEKWGFKDKNGKIIIEAKYDRIVELNDFGYGGIKIADKWGIINKEGNIIVEPKYYIDDSLSDPEFLNRFYKGYYATSGGFYME